MEQLSCRTRGGSSPKGKPKVYFCSHPKDREVYLNGIIEDILCIHNCAVYYPSSDYIVSNDEKNCISNLEHMQLLVVPITETLLTTYSYAMDKEIPYAMEKHIPILPLVTDNGLIELYNQKFNNYQFINYTLRNYEKEEYCLKLKQYINAILVDDSTKEKIENIFRSCVFISYKREDRQYAQSFMRFLHKYDEFLDVSVWYDEYLVLGSFKDGIDSAISSSDLFAMVVTPKILADGNYVLTYEYPKAQEMKKNIIPIIFEHTDKKELEKKYKQIPVCMHIKDQPHLEQALREALKKRTKTKTLSDDEFNYLIGLAFLSGIKVEVDYNIAFIKIKQSAEHGFYDAIKKLVSMYRKGEGIGRDHEKSIFWQKKLVDDLSRRLVNEESVDVLCQLAKETWVLGDYLKEDGDSQAYIQYKNMISYCEKLYYEYDCSEENAYLLFESYYNLGDCELESKNFFNAQKMFEKALKIAEKTGKERCYSSTYKKIGYIYQEWKGDTLTAEKYYQNGLEIDKKLYETAPTFRSKRDYAISCDRIGILYEELENYKKAKHYYDLAFTICQEYYLEENTILAKDDFAVLHKQVGNAEFKLENIASALLHYQTALEIDRNIYNETDSIESKRNISVDLVKLGDVTKEVHYYFDALKIRIELFEKLHTVGAKRDLAIIYQKLGDVLGKRSYYEVSLMIFEDIFKSYYTIESREDIATILHKIAILDLKKIDYEKLKRAADILKSLIQDSPSMNKYKDELSKIESILRH